MAPLRPLSVPPACAAARLAPALWLLCLILGLSQAGCASPPRYLAEPQTIDAQGDWRHDPSGMIFPATVAGFRRVEIAHFAAVRPDVAVAYNLTGIDGPIAATVYLDAAPSLFTVGLAADAVGAAREHACAATFERRRHELEDRTLARFLGQKSVVLRKNDRLRPGRLATFAYTATFAGHRQPLITELASFCFVGDDWSIEFRFTYPTAGTAEDRVAGFMQALAWTGQIAD